MNILIQIIKIDNNIQNFNKLYMISIIFILFRTRFLLVMINRKFQCFFSS